MITKQLSEIFTNMKILIVGGTGLIGGDAALYFKDQGHDVTLIARKPSTVKALAELPFIQTDYITDDINDGRLKGFDALFFSAAADIRNIPLDGSISPDDFYNKANDIAVPQFFQAAKNAGIKKCVYIGTFYPQIAPEKIGSCPYVTSRHNTCEAVMALNDESFHVSALNPPFVLGHIDGMNIPHIQALVDYALGKIPEMPVFAPQGATNHVSSQSIAIAALSILTKKLKPKAYLIGDENLNWQEYLQRWFDAAASSQNTSAQQVPLQETEHPMFPYVIQFAGVNAEVSYEMSQEDIQALDFPSGQVTPLIKEIASKS